MKIMVAVPCMDSLDVRFVDSLTQMLFHKCSENIALSVQYHSGSLVYEARNTLAKLAVENEFTHILWLDSDMVFEPDLLDRMIAALGDKDFISGLYFTRRMPVRPCIFSKCGYSKGEDGLYTNESEYLPYIPKEQIEIEACGFGCVLMKTDMVKTIIDKQSLPFAPMFGFGEDLSFCIKARELGYKLYLDPSILCGHVAKLTIGNPSLIDDWNLTHSQGV